MRDIGTLVTSVSQARLQPVRARPRLGPDHKYPPTLDGGSFGEPENYLVTANESVADYVRLYIDDGASTP